MIKRKVFFVSGYDPRGPDYYYQLMGKEVKKWNVLSNRQVTIGDKLNEDFLETRFLLSDEDLEVDFSLLHWNDLVEASWNGGFRELVSLVLNAYHHIFKSKGWQKLKSHGGMDKAFKLPLKIGLIISLCIFMTIALIFFALQFSYGFLILILFIFPIVIFSVSMFRRYNLMWLIKSIKTGFSMFNRHEYNWDERIEQWRERVYDSNLKEYDEVWLVSHSYGTMLASFLLHELSKDSFQDTDIKMLTLGTVAPIFLLFEDDNKGHDVLKNLANEDIEWFDISSPADPICFALSNPFVQAGDSARAKAYLTSPRFHKAYSKERYSKLKKNKLALHTSYLRAPELLGYPCYLDCLLTTAGLEPLKQNNV